MLELIDMLPSWMPTSGCLDEAVWCVIKAHGNTNCLVLLACVLHFIKESFSSKSLSHIGLVASKWPLLTYFSGIILELWEVHVIMCSLLLLWHFTQSLHWIFHVQVSPDPSLPFSFLWQTLDDPEFCSDFHFQVSPMTLFSPSLSRAKL